MRNALVTAALVVLLAYRRQWHWTGLPAVHAASSRADARPAKTLWDWLQLLGIPVALAALAFLLNDAQSNRDQRREDVPPGVSRDGDERQGRARRNDRVQNIQQEVNRDTLGRIPFDEALQ